MLNALETGTLSAGRAAVMAGAAAAALAALAAWTVGSTVVYHVLPFAWTAEPERLAEKLGLREGSRVAEIGAGGGEMAVALARTVGPLGGVIATEIDAGRREAIARRARAAGLANVEVREAGARDPRLGEGCCDAVAMRNVLHHVRDWPAFAAGVARAVRPRGRVVVIDFAPGTIWHLGRDHGADPDRVAAVFSAAGLRPVERVDRWGGGMYLLAFER